MFTALLFLPSLPLHQANYLRKTSKVHRLRKNERYLDYMNYKSSGGTAQQVENSFITQNASQSLPICMADSWKHPHWIASRLNCETASAFEDDSLKGMTFTEDAPSLVQPPRGPPSKRILFLKVLCTVFLFGSVAVAWTGYLFACNQTRDLVVKESSRVLGRPLKVGRVVRFLPSGGLRLGKSDLSRGNLPSTTPEVRAEHIDIRCRGLRRAMALSKPLFVDVSLRNAKISVHQKVVIGRKGKEVTEWDAGIPPMFAASGAKIDNDLSSESDQSAASTVSSLFRIQPGTFNILNSTVFLHTGVLADYGHHGEIVEVRNVFATAKFPYVKYLKGLKSPSKPLFPFDLEGAFTAEIKGSPVGGGTLNVSARADAQKLLHLKPGDDVCDLEVNGQSVASSKIATFLSLPFRADVGECSADVKMKFFYRSSNAIPEMSGFADLRNVALRFHPDPKTPEFANIDGKLRFDRKELFLDGPTGSLGTLPMTVVGSIGLDSEYNLLGYIPSVDVNNILETFDVEKFVPVIGSVRGEARMSGILEEPTVAGWAETTSGEIVFDRLPLESAGVEFTWEAIPGMLQFTDIHAKILGQGSVSGRGGLFFDMTKETPYGMKRPVHHKNSPKAKYWNPESTLLLPEVPNDVMEIDEFAPQRPYDSMRFDFKVQDVNGPDLLTYYGGKYGGISAMSIGTVEGTGVMAGHAKDANCRVLWRSVSAPPEVQMRGEKYVSSAVRLKDFDIIDAKVRDARPIETSEGETTGNDEKKLEQSEVERDADTNPPGTGRLKKKTTKSRPLAPFKRDAREWLGGGEFQGLVYIKLGDLPAARRIKARTTVKSLDARRLGWADDTIRSSLEKSPKLDTSLDSYFTGVMYQRAIIPPGTDQVPRTPRMELLGVDGALAVRNLKVNQVAFPKPMTGSFSFSSSDFSMSLKEPSQEQNASNSRTKIQVSKDNRKNETNGFSKPQNSKEKSSQGDELTVSASLHGSANITFRRGKSEMVASVNKDDRSGHQIADVFARDMKVEDFLGSDYRVSGSNTVEASLDTDFRLDLSSQEGQGNITMHNPRVGPFRLASASSNVRWRGRKIILSNSVLRSKDSEYGLSGTCILPLNNDSRFSWNGDLTFSQASLQEIVSLFSTGQAIAGSLHTWTTSTIPPASRDAVHWLYWLSSVVPSTQSNSKTLLDVPDLPLEEQVAWFDQYLKEEKRSKNRNEWTLSSLMANESPVINSSLVQGRLSGIVRIKYESDSNSKSLFRIRDQPSDYTKGSLLDMLRNLSATFDISGTNWRSGSYSLSRAFAKGRLLDNTFSLGTLQCENDQGFYGQASGYVRTNGKIELYGDMKRAPAALLARLTRTPVRAGGEYSGRFDLKGHVLSPEGQGELVWTNASLNGQFLQEARSEIKFQDGRCGVNVFARVGGRGSFRRKGEVIRLSAELPAYAYLDRVLRETIPEPLYSSLNWNEYISSTVVESVDKRVKMSVDIRKFGLVFLNAIAPNLGWIDGSGDVVMVVSGSLRLPIIKGRVSIREGKVWPKFLTKSIDNVRGDLLFDEAGTVSVKSLYGRCGGKGFSIRGDLLLSKLHERILEEVVTHGQVISVQGSTVPMANTEKESNRAARSLLERRAFATTMQSKVARGLSFEIGEVPVDVQNVMSGAVSGKVFVKRNLANPEISGAVTIQHGTINLSNASSSRDKNILNEKDAKRELRRAERKLQILKSFENFKKSRQREKNGEGRKGGDDKDVSQQSLSNSETPAKRSNILNGNTADFKRFQVSLGREMRLLYPFILDVEAQGTVEVNGTAQKIAPKGTIQFSQGFVNLLASRMSIMRGENSYLQFSGDAGDAPILNVALEDDDVVIRVNKSTPSHWADHLEIKSKRGRGMENNAWVHAIRSKLEDGAGSLSIQTALLKLANSYVSQVAGVTGGVGSVEWRMHPILGGVSGESSGDVAEDLGVGAKVNMGKVSVSLRAALSGMKALVLELRPWQWFSVYLGADGENLEQKRVEFEIGWSGDAERDVGWDSETDQDFVLEVDDMKDSGGVVTDSGGG